MGTQWHKPHTLSWLPNPTLATLNSFSLRVPKESQGKPKTRRWRQWWRELVSKKKKKGHTYAPPLQTLPGTETMCELCHMTTQQSWKACLYLSTEQDCAFLNSTNSTAPIMWGGSLFVLLHQQINIACFNLRVWSLTSWSPRNPQHTTKLCVHLQRFLWDSTHTCSLIILCVNNYDYQVFSLKNITALCAHHKVAMTTKMSFVHFNKIKHLQSAGAFTGDSASRLTNVSCLFGKITSLTSGKAQDESQDSLIPIFFIALMNKIITELKVINPQCISLESQSKKIFKNLLIFPW